MTIRNVMMMYHFFLVLAPPASEVANDEHTPLQSGSLYPSLPQPYPSVYGIPEAPPPYAPPPYEHHLQTDNYPTKVWFASSQRKLSFCWLRQWAPVVSACFTKVLPQCSLQLKWWLLQGRTKGEAEQTAASMVCSWHICGMSWKVVACIRHYWGMTWTYLLNATAISANWSLTWCKTLQEMYHFHLSNFWDTFICDILINPKWHKSLGKTGHFREGQSCINYGIQTLIWCNSGGNIDSWKA